METRPFSSTSVWKDVYKRQGIRRVGDDGIEAVRLKLAEDLQRIPVQDLSLIHICWHGQV